MRKYLTIIFSAILSIMIFSFAGCTDGEEKPTEINQWDYFNEYVNYSLYDYIENNTDWTKTPITNSAGETQQNCYQTFLKPDNNVNIKDMVFCSDYNFYRQLAVVKKKSDKTITMTKLLLQIFAEEACEMKFSLKVAGDAEPRAYATITAVAGVATELLFENFVEYTWLSNTTNSITITLENPAAIGNIKYGFSNLQITLRNDA